MLTCADARPFTCELKYCSTTTGGLRNSASRDDEHHGELVPVLHALQRTPTGHYRGEEQRSSPQLDAGHRAQQVVTAPWTAYQVPHEDVVQAHGGERKEHPHERTGIIELTEELGAEVTGDEDARDQHRAQAHHLVREQPGGVVEVFPQAR
jgi:hypothetical protein